jgi:hypothetical protein
MLEQSPALVICFDASLSGWGRFVEELLRLDHRWQGILKGKLMN